ISLHLCLCPFVLSVRNYLAGNDFWVHLWALFIHQLIYLMKYRSFQGNPVSEIGLGTWQLGSADWGNVSDEEAFAILQAFTDAGGNFIDTADVYGMGISEQLIGRFIQQHKTPLFIATKLGRRGD